MIDYHKEYYQKNKEKIKARSNNYYIENKEKVLKMHKKYDETIDGKLSLSKSNKKYRSINPERYKAHNILLSSIRNGSIIKQNCIVCSESKNKINGHHEDYSKPLVVMWLCDKHHKQLHNSENIYEKLCIENYGFVYDLHSMPRLVK